MFNKILKDAFADIETGHEYLLVRMDKWMTYAQEL
jgi:hypothetical protein